MVKIDRVPPSGQMKTPDLVPAPSRSGSTQNMASNIQVVVRVRPLNDKEMELNNRVVVDVVDETMLVFDPKEDERPFFYQGVQQNNKNYLKRANKELKFVFDHVCDMNATNKNVFETTTKEMLSALMEGYNCSVFVYGATGAGKTFTMIGNKEHPGITYLTMEHLFFIINSFEKEREFDIGVSYIEVYNENVFDLLKPSKKPLQLREDNKYGVMVAGLTLNNIKTAQELLNLVENGNLNRTQHPTDANAESSRSHAVFQVYVKMRYKTSSQLRIVKLSMIDLAGSERASATGCIGDRFKEGANINKSLLSLGNCINRLADGSAYIPYRDSKLTRLLKDSLGGNCKTVMIANVSPSSISYEDTYNTLKYAARANKIQLTIKKNIVDGDMRVSQYVKISEELKKKVKELEAELSAVSAKQIVRTQDLAKDKAREEWRRRIAREAEGAAVLETEMMALMSRQRVLALRQRLRARTFTHLAHLAHSPSTAEQTEQIEQMGQLCNEEIPRQERNAENYVKHAIDLDSKIQTAWSKWNESRKKLYTISGEALKQCPDLADYIETIQLKSELRQAKARDELKYKLLEIESESNTKNTECTSDMLLMLKKLYFTLKGYDKATPSLMAEYMDILKKVKSSKGITWYDNDRKTDPHFKFITSLDFTSPPTNWEYEINDEIDSNIDTLTDSDDLADVENRPVKVSSKKRKGTPIKLANNETIIINDSFEMLDTTRNLNSAKKIRRQVDVGLEEENYGAIDPKDLNSTFVLAGKMDSLKAVKLKSVPQPVKRGLTDRTNTMNREQKTGQFGERAKIVKPVVGKALLFRRPFQASTVPPPAATRGAGGPGFGSSLSRNGTSLQRNTAQDSRVQANITQKSVGFKAMRPRERVQNHPYTRPTPPAARK